MCNWRLMVTEKIMRDPTLLSFIFGGSNSSYYDRFRDWSATHRSLILAIATAVGFCIGWGSLTLIFGDGSLSFRLFTIGVGGLVCGAVSLLLAYLSE
jgi:hypothetical protein